MKRAIIIICSVLLIGTGLYLGRHYIFKSVAPTELLPAEPETVITTDIEDDEQDTLSLLADLEFFDYWVDFADRSVYAITADGAIYRVPAGGAPEKLYSAGAKDVSEIKSAPQGKNVLIEAGDKQRPFFSIMNPEEKTNKFLPLGTTAAAWSPDSKEIVFAKDQSLNIFTVANGKSRFITNLNLTDFLLEWKKPREIYLGTRPTAGVSGQWWSYALDKKTLLPISEELPGLNIRWATGGQNGLQFTNKTDSQGNTLSLINFVDPPVSLNIKTLPEKCTPAATIIYCGELINADIKRLPDAYYQRAYTADNIIKINTTGFSSKKVIYFNEPEKASLDIYRPTVVGPFLYFLNRNDNKIYSLVLPKEA